MNVVEVPETIDEWAERLWSRARNGETIVIREGEWGLDRLQLIRLRDGLEQTGGKVHVAPARRQGLG